MGTSVGQRAVRETFLVQIEGVDAAITDPDAWPPAYRAGVIEGLLFSADGTLTTSPKAVDSAAQLLSLHPDAVELLDRLHDLAENAAWTAPAVGTPPSLDEVMTAINRAAQRLPTGLRNSWSRIAALVEGTESLLSPHHGGHGG